jgi:alkaline phosphatase
MRIASLLLSGLLVSSCGASTAPRAGQSSTTDPGRARNVVLFLADAGGNATIHAASLFAHGAPNSLYLQQMPHVALSDTTTAAELVTDSAAGMTAIVTGERTVNGVVAQSASAVPRERDGEPLKTILEYAEERGLATGVISNDSLTGATPASTYAHVNHRDKTAEIFLQAFAPRFGDGVDVMFGSGRPTISRRLEEAGTSLDAVAAEHGRAILWSLDEVPADADRAIVLFENQNFDVNAAIDKAVAILSRNPNGYFLMVEVDTHTNNIRRGLERMVMMDRAIEHTASIVGDDTLLLFTADHSFDIRMRGGRLGTSPDEGADEAVAAARESKSDEVRARVVRMQDSHSGEPVIATAQGPGAERVGGYMLNTDLFDVMMAAYGWAEQ